MNQKILDDTNEYYTKKIEEFGTTSRGVDWNSRESQRLRFEQLSKILPERKGEHFSICDYGCGYGSYLEYLKEQKYDCSYCGIDISYQMIKAAVDYYGKTENARFIQGAEIIGQHDYIIASGIFNVRQDVEFEEWTSYMLEVLEKFNAHANKGFAFNCLTKYSDLEYMKEYLYYADPLFYFDYSKKNFSRNVALLHDYELYEFTLLVRKQEG